MSDLIGERLGDYRLDRLIGAGGMGTVYEATDLRLNRSVALKLMHPLIANQPEFRARLKSEAQTAAALDHPSIIKIFDFGQAASGQLYVAMEYIRDGSLRDHMQRQFNRTGGGLDVALALQVAIQIAEALDAAHRAGVIHRDVKPGNIILKRLERPEEEGFAAFRAVLTDFGLVQVTRSQRVTESGITMGTPIYMSPEQCEGKELDGRSDLYSLGVVLYEMLAGQPPFEFNALSAAIRTHVLNEQPPALTTLRPNIPPVIDVLLARALAKQPAQRFASGRQMAEQLRIAFGAISDTPTRIFSRAEAGPAASASATVTPPDGYQLAVRVADSSVIDRYPLPRAQMTLGRYKDNDLLLTDPAVSRHHARLEYSDAGWRVRPLPTQNGTLLNGRRLRTDMPVAIDLGEPIQIGPYELWLDHRERRVVPPPRTPQSAPRRATTPPPTGGGPARHSTRGGPARGGEPADEAPTVFFTPGDENSPFALYLDRQEVRVTPGQPLDLLVDIVNRSDSDDAVRLAVFGLEDAWVSVDNRFVAVAANDRITLPLRINIPQTARPRIGLRRIRVELVAQRHVDAGASVSGMLEIMPFFALSAILTPDTLALPGTVALQIANEGNTPNVYALQPDIGSDQIAFEGPNGDIPIEAGERVEVTLGLSDRRRLLNLFRQGEAINYTLRIVPRNGEPMIIPGVAQRPTSLLVYAGYLLFMLVVLACGLITLIVLDPIGRNRPVRATVPVIAAVASATPTPIDYPLTLTAAVPTPTLAAGSGALDSDGDGLRDDQEQLLATDPLLADTDGDGLTDFQELFIYGTQPRLRDSDGDGVADGDEVRLGSDPLRRPGTPTPSVATATATLLPTLPATETPASTPTLAATASATTVPPSDTPAPTPTADLTIVPLPTRTDMPTATPETPTPTASATPEPPTTTPTVAATATATAAATAAATVVPLPTFDPALPQLTCATIVPFIDGALNAEEWPQLIGSFAPDGFPGRVVDLFLVKDASALYLAFEISDDAPQLGDSLRINLDVDGSGGDPDANDRRLQIGFDDTLTLQAGQGSSADGVAWGVPIASDGIDYMIAPDPNGWTVEVRIDYSALPALAAQPRLGLQMLFSGEGIAAWPPLADGDNANSWQLLNNAALCPPP